MADPIARRGKWFLWDDSTRSWQEWSDQEKKWNKRSSPPPPLEKPGLFQSDWFKPIFPLLAGALLTAVILAPLGRWIQERSKVADLKSTIITQLTEGATDTLSAGRVLSFNLLPEQQKHRALEESFKRKKARSKGGNKPRVRKLRKLRKELQETRELALVAEATRFGQARENWLRVSASNRSKFKAYFQDENSREIRKRWSDFSLRLLGYLRLGVGLSSIERESEIEKLETYLEDLQGEPEPDAIDWDLLKRDRSSYDNSEGERASTDYERIGELLTKKLDSLVDDIVLADSTIYMDNWLDWKD